MQSAVVKLTDYRHVWKEDFPNVEVCGWIGHSLIVAKNLDYLELAAEK